MIPPDENPGNPLGRQSETPPGPIPAPPVPEPPQTPNAPAGEPDTAPAAASPRNMEDAIVRMAATIDGLTVELEQVRKRQRGSERQLIMIFGVLAVLLWRANAPAVRARVTEAIPNAE